MEIDNDIRIIDIFASYVPFDVAKKKKEFDCYLFSTQRVTFAIRVIDGFFYFIGLSVDLLKKSTFYTRSRLIAIVNYVPDTVTYYD